MSEGVPNDNKQGADTRAQIILSLVKLLPFFILLSLLVWKWPFFADWLQGVKHAEGFGITVDRQDISNITDDADAYYTSDDAPGVKIKRESNPTEVLSAVKRSVLLGNTIHGAKVLWVDQHPDNNKYERRILEDFMSVSVQLAWSTADALKIVQTEGETPDLVISNMTRAAEPVSPLVKCKGAFFDFPNESQRAQYAGDIWQYNRAIQRSPPAGFSLAEQLATVDSKYGDSSKPRIIFYTGASGGISSNQCARVVTNRPDVLFNQVIGVLAQVRAARTLEPPTSPTNEQTVTSSAPAVNSILTSKSSPTASTIDRP
jgi:CheY-like chemotaxis protein